MRILHFIDSLDYGGAETLLMSYIPMLNEYEHVVVTLKGPNAFKKANYKYIQLDLNPVKGFFKTVKAMKTIIASEKIDIVHSHSFWTNIISRFATSSKIRLFNHYHFADYDTMKDKMSVKGMILIDKLSSRKDITRVAVSNYVVNILKDIFPKATINVLPNFVDCINFRQMSNSTVIKDLRVVAIGNCSLEKNYDLILQAFESLKDEPIYIDIIGGGGRLDFYKDEVKKRGLEKVRFCGSIPYARERLIYYDLFLSASKSETFGIAVLEGVCAKLPLLLSDIPAFNEIAPENTRFFNPFDGIGLANCLKDFIGKEINIDDSEYETILQKYSASTYLLNLKKLYNN